MSIAEAPPIEVCHKWLLAYLHALIWADSYQVRDVGNLPFVR